MTAVKHQISAALAKGVAVLHWLDAFATAHHTAIIWSCGLLYKLALDAMYVWAAYPTFSYGGLIYQPNSFKYLLSNVLYVLIFAYLPKQEKDTAGFLLNLQFAFTVAPMLTVYALVNHSTLYMIAVFCCVMLQIYIIRRPRTGSGQVHIKGIRNYVTVALGVLVIFAVSVPILYNGFDGLKAFDFSRVYEIRERVSYPAGFEYIQSWIANVVLPFAVLMFVVRKKYLWCAVCFAMQVLMFLESGRKLYLLILFPMLFVYLFAKSGHLLKLMYAGLMILSFLTAFCCHLDYSQHLWFGEFLAALVAVRALLGPAHNKFLYYKCFSQYPKILFSDGQIGKMLGLTYPYAGGSGQVIYAYDGGEFMVSNSCTGYLGDSYAQMGFLGLLLMSLLFAFVIRSIQSYDNKKNFELLTALFTVYIIILNDASLFTTLFSGGMLLAYLLVFIYLSHGSKGADNGI